MVQITSWSSWSPGELGLRLGPCAAWRWALCPQPEHQRAVPSAQKMM